MGYHRPVSQFNPGKQSEHAERRFYSQPGIARATDETCVANRCS